MQRYSPKQAGVARSGDFVAFAQRVVVIYGALSAEYWGRNVRWADFYAQKYFAGVFKNITFAFTEKFS